MAVAEKNQTIDELLVAFKRHELDSGSPEVQIIMLSYKISYLTRHLNDFPSDASAKRTLTKIVHQRRKSLQYLNSQNTNQCQKLVAALGIRFKF